jgi:hypothetical protein
MAFAFRFAASREHQSLGAPTHPTENGRRARPGYDAKDGVKSMPEEGVARRMEAAKIGP